MQIVHTLLLANSSHPLLKEEINIVTILDLVDQSVLCNCFVNRLSSKYCINNRVVQLFSGLFHSLQQILFFKLLSNARICLCFFIRSDIWRSQIGGYNKNKLQNLLLFHFFLTVYRPNNCLII